MSAFCTVRRAVLPSIRVPGHDEPPDRPLRAGRPVPRPEQHVVAEGAVADPALGAVQHPFVTAPDRRRGQAAGDVRAVLRFREREGAGGAEGGGVVEQPVLLILRAETVQGLDEEVVVDHEERAQGDVRPAQLRDEQPHEEVAVPAARRGVDLQGGECGQEFERELGGIPPGGRVGLHLGVQEVAHFRELGPLLSAQKVFDAVEIGGGQFRGHGTAFPTPRGRQGACAGAGDLMRVRHAGDQPHRRPAG